MQQRGLSQFARVELAPPSYLSQPAAGIDVSASGVKIAVLKEKWRGIELVHYAEERLPAGAIQGGEVATPDVLIHTLSELAKRFRIRTANITLPEARGYLFEADVPGSTRNEWLPVVEQHLEEYVPLPPMEVAYDIAPLTKVGDMTHVVGIGYARRVVDTTLQIFEAAGIEVKAIEAETFSIPRALLPHGDTETVLIIDIGKTTTKLLVVSHRLPRFATTLDVGGHALTLAVQKYFGVTEEEAKRVKAEKGIVADADNEEYLTAMLSTVSVIREEIMRRFDYWQGRATTLSAHAPITRAILVGGNSTVRGLPEYLESALKVPVELGDVFRNMTPRDHWLPPIDRMESLAYATSIGLALREYVP